MRWKYSHDDYCDRVEKKSWEIPPACRNGGYYITRNGKVVARLSNPQQARVDIAKSLLGILSSDVTLEESKSDQLGQI